MRLLLRRGSALVSTLLLVTLAVAVLLAATPGDPARLLAGEEASAERVDEVRHELGLDRPVLEQYADYMGGLLRLDLGESLFSGEAVTSSIGRTVPVTLSLTVTTMLLAVTLGLGFGAVAALRRGKATDRVITAAMAVLMAGPPFVVGLLLVAAFAIALSWLPATGYQPLSDGLGDWLRHLILPTIALALPSAAELARQVRDSLSDAMEQDHILALQAKGLTPWRLVGLHAAKAAAIPVVTVLGLQVARILSGILVVERVFAIPGFGSLTLTAVTRHDYPVIQGVVVVSAAAVLVLNTLVDLSYLYLNPRLRAER